MRSVCKIRQLQPSLQPSIRSVRTSIRSIRPYSVIDKRRDNHRPEIINVDKLIKFQHDRVDVIKFARVLPKYLNESMYPIGYALGATLAREDIRRGINGYTLKPIKSFDVSKIGASEIYEICQKTQSQTFSNNVNTLLKAHKV